MAGEIYMLESKIGSWDSGMRLRDWSGLASMATGKDCGPPSDSLDSLVTKQIIMPHD